MPSIILNKGSFLLERKFFQKFSKINPQIRIMLANPQFLANDTALVVMASHFNVGSYFPSV